MSVHQYHQKKSRSVSLNQSGFDDFMLKEVVSRTYTLASNVIVRSR